MGRTSIKVALALLALVAAPLAAQPRDKAVATDISLVELDEPYQGSMAMIEGRIEGEPLDRFTLANLSIFQPVKVSLIAEDVAKPVTLTLGKFDWKEDFGGGPTGAAGQVVKEFTTQGDLLMTVSGEPGAGYRLIVWAGDEVPPAMEEVIVPASEARGGGLPAWAWGGLVAILLGAGGWYFLRNRRRPA